MKKWLIILTITCLVSGLTSVVLAGHVYYNDLQTYEAYDNVEINKEKLENVYITSEVPIEIHPTNGEPYVEFTQKFVDLIGNAPKYQLEVKEKGNGTDISLKQTDNISFNLGVKEKEAKVMIYLPQQDINYLEVNNWDWEYSERKVIDLTGINVGELKIEQNDADITLNGTYSKANINASDSNLDMISTTPVRLSTRGMSEQNLEGIYESINIEDAYNEININSLEPTKVKIQGCASKIELEGKYEEIDIDSENGKIDINSQGECKLITSGYSNKINANGAFKELSFSEVDSDIDVQTTITPNSVRMLDEATDSSLNLILPSNTPGLTLKYVRVEDENLEYYTSEEYNEINYLEGEEINLQSDFQPLSQQVKNGQYIYTYGNGSMRILINRNSNIILDLIDGAYSSVINGSKVENIKEIEAAQTVE